MLIAFTYLIASISIYKIYVPAPPCPAPFRARHSSTVRRRPDVERPARAGDCHHWRLARVHKLNDRIRRDTCLGRGDG